MITATQPVVSHHTNKMAAMPVKPDKNPIPATYDGNDEFMMIYAEDGTLMTPEQVTAYLQDALDSVDNGEGRPIEDICKKFGIDYDAL